MSRILELQRKRKDLVPVSQEEKEVCGSDESGIFLEVVLDRLHCALTGKLG